MYKDKFKKFGGEFIPDIVEYLMEIYNKDPNITISIGCDSMQKRKRTLYAITIMIYNQDIKNGAHVVFYRESVPKIYDTFTRLYQEAQYMNDLGIWLDYELTNKGFKRNDLNILERKKYKFNISLEKGDYTKLQLHEREAVIENIHLSDEELNRQYKNIDIHVDLNSLKWNIKNRFNKSYKVYEAAVPWLRGNGFRVFPKPIAYAATSAADLLLK